MPATQTPPAQQANPWAINLAQRQAVLSQSVRRKTQIASTTFNPANGNVYVCNTILPVGLILGFLVEYSATFAELGSGSTTVTDFGGMNVFSNIQFTDLQNNQRHNAPGMQYALTQSFKDRQPFVSAQSMAQKEGNFGANWTLASTTAPTTSATGNATGRLLIPLAYDDHDLRGAIYANVVSNQMNLQFTVNPNPAPATGDDTFAVFYGSGASSISSITINIYQIYLDNLPVGKSGLVLPQLDISTLYQLQYTNFQGSIVANQDFYIQYTNFRRFMSITGIYNSTGTQGGRLTGADLSYLATVSANLTFIHKNGPNEQARVARRILGTDPPPGLYYFPSRSHPINTLATGNMQIDINPITASNAYWFNMWEFFSNQNTLTQAGSLAANG